MTVSLLTDPIYRALNPGGKRFLELRKLSPKLNPFYATHEIEVYALVSSGAFPHIKTVPTIQMMTEDYEAGLYKGMHTIVVPSSGNTAHAVGRLAPSFGFTTVKAIVSADVPESKKGVVSALSCVSLISPAGKKSVKLEALEQAEREGHYLLDQYQHEGNMRAHERFTGPQILNLLGKNLGVIAIAMGSGGTAGGVGRYFKQERPNTTVLGVRPSLGERVPGTRDQLQMADVVTLPWREGVDAVVEVDRNTSFLASRLLWTEVEPQPGPSSGLAWQGLMKYLRGLAEQDKSALRELIGKSVAFICPDDGRFYSERIGGELDPGQGTDYSI